MQKGQLQKWGQDMIAITFKTCLRASGLSVAGGGAFAVFKQIDGNFWQILLQLVVYGTCIGIAIVIVAGIFKALLYGIGSFLIWFDDYLSYERPAKLTFSGKRVALGEKTEFYIKVKNRYWSDINAHVSFHVAIQEGQSFIPHEEHIKWSGLRSHIPVALIKRRKTRDLHFATIHENGRMSIHLSQGTSIPITRQPDGHIFSLSALVDGKKLPDPKEKHFDIIVSYNDEGKPNFKIKKVRRNELRNYFDPHQI